MIRKGTTGCTTGTHYVDALRAAWSGILGLDGGTGASQLVPHPAVSPRASRPSVLRRRWRTRGTENDLSAICRMAGPPNTIHLLQVWRRRVTSASPHRHFGDATEGGGGQHLAARGWNAPNYAMRNLATQYRPFRRQTREKRGRELQLSLLTTLNDDLYNSCRVNVRRSVLRQQHSCCRPTLLHLDRYCDQTSAWVHNTSTHCWPSLALVSTNSLSLRCHSSSRP